MAGPVRTAPRTRAAGDQPPRPPNAWILYRSDRVREMPPPLPGQLRTQADVSKAISEQWRNESEATRAEYERRAEMKKAEHHAQYPDYRFQPKSKEQKERQRLEKKQEKERQPKISRARTAAPTVAQITSTSSQLHPHRTSDPSYYAEARFGAAGPSPPLSAAASPSDNNSCLELQGDELHIPPSNHASPYPDKSRALSPLTVPPSSCDENSTSHSQTNPLFSETSPDLNQCTHLVDASPPSSSSSYAMTHSLSSWDTYSTPPTPANNLTASDFVSFGLQPITLQNVRSWITEPGAFDEAMQALLSATGDPSIFQLDNFDANTLTSNPSGEIEVSMGNSTPYPFDSSFIPDFSGFDFSGPSTMTSQTLAANSQSPTDEAAEYTSLFSGNVMYSPLDPENYNADDFINFDGGAALFQTNPSADTLSTSQPLDQTSERLHPTPYAPPAGAVYSSTRRVAGSWKPSFAISDSHMDASPPRSWGVPAI